MEKKQRHQSFRRKTVNRINCLKRLLQSTLILVLLGLSAIIHGASLPSAMNSAVRDIKSSGEIPEGSNVIISGIINYYTNNQDEISKRIETDLFFAFQKQFPEVRLVDIEESLTGVSSGNSIFIKGNYQRKGKKGTLYLKAFKGTMNGEVIYQSVVEFDMEYRKTNLVAVLDIEAKFLNHEQRRIFSDVFREALGESAAFNMVSSADIDRMKPEEMQKATGCTRDSCAALIGKQLGVDRVISTSLRRLNQSTYYFSGKIMNIQDGLIVKAKTVKHTGDLSSFDAALVELAKKLTQDMTPTVVEQPEAPPQPVESDLTVYDPETGLTWQKGEGGEMDWSGARDYCNNLELAGDDDWRLPDHLELESSFLLNDKFPDLVDSYYWSSTTNKDYKYYAWGMTASTGYMFEDGSKSSYYNVRCVRGVKEPEKPYYVDLETGLEWQKGEGGVHSWNHAAAYCKRLELNGLDDWRLPTKEELMTTNRIKDKFPDLVSGYYWTSTTNTEYPDYAWGMESSEGSLFDNGHKGSRYNVRCVRGEVDRSAMTLEDEETGLIWQRGEAGQMGWEDGIEYCNKLTLAGHSDWRLPSKEELETTFAIQEQFPGLVDGYYWSSTEGGGMGFWAWGLTTSTGSLFHNGIKIKSYNVRCVRGAFRY